MSVDYHSYAVIGVKIDPEKLYTSGKKRGCSCPKVPTGNFCSDCGAEAYIEFRDPIDLYKEDEEILGYKVILGSDEKTAVIAITWSETSSSNYGEDKSFTQIPHNLEELKNKMRDTLGPLGLWDEKKFGLWSVLYCSY